MLEVSTHSQIFDPAVLALDGRWHAGLGDNAEASIEGTAHRLDDTGPSDADRSFYSGRAGVRTNPGKSGAAFFAGAGGGYAPAGGGFASADSGLAIGYDNCTVVPVMQASAFISQPLQARRDRRDRRQRRAANGYAEAHDRRRVSRRPAVLAVAVELSRRRAGPVDHAGLWLDDARRCRRLRDAVRRRPGIQVPL